MPPGSRPQHTYSFPIRPTKSLRRYSPYPSNPWTHGRKSLIGPGSVSAVSTPTSTQYAQTKTSRRLQRKLTTLRVVLKRTKVKMKGLPPIQLAIAGLGKCLSHIRIWKQAHHHYERIMSNLTSRVIQLQSHVVGENPWNLSSSISNVAGALREQTSFIWGHQNRSQIERLPIIRVESELKCYQRIEMLLQRLQADISLGIWGVVEDQQMVCARSVRDLDLGKNTCYFKDTRLKDLCPVYDAYHNAALSNSVAKRAGCTKGTRMELLDMTKTWIHDEEGVKVYWLNGMAGTGKTTIAYSVCEMLQEKYQLGGSFFCSRNSPDCRDVSRIVPTIAYQLGRYSNPYRKAVCDVLRNDPDAAKRNITTQFKLLISGPLTAVDKAIPPHVVVVIDALDECTDTDGTRDVLNTLLQYAGNLPIKFFVASRPEPEISQCMADPEGSMRSIIWLHDIEQSLVQADIKLYLAEALAPVRLSPSELNLLAAHAGCLFIFAATAVRYILPTKGSVNSVQRMHAVLGLQPDRPNKSYQDIDELYATILSNALDERIYEESELTARRQVLWTVICAREPLSMSALGEVLDLSDEKSVQIMIQPLQSVLHVSGRTNVVSTLHTSFADFLLNEKRAGQFYCNEDVQNSYLAKYCLRLMDRSLEFNICDLETSYQFDRDVSSLQARIPQRISTGLFYSCQYWGDHMTRNPPTSSSLSLLKSFLQQHLLFWMEVLNLKGRIGLGEHVLSQILGWLPTHDGNHGLQDFTYDARNFLTTFAGNPTSLSTPHIYVSVLPFTSKQSLVYTTYWMQARGLVPVNGRSMEIRRQSALATWALEDTVNTLALSKDGKRVAFGSDRKEVSVWDVASGTCILGPLKGHTARVWSVAYSPDNTRIASGSEDGTIRIWHAQKGEPITEPIHGHSESIYSVAFSVDGARLASGSEDGTVRIWDADTGVPVGDPFKEHQGAVWSVAFSPDGGHLASGSRDSTIRVWNWENSATAQVQLKEHTDAVYSIAYASDGRRLASGSHDQTVRVWDMSNGTPLTDAFEGHTGAVSYVSISPDGTRVISGSHDRTIRIWETMSGTLVAGPFEGHRGTINSVLFTVDGTRILSSSNDHTICIWDARHKPEGATELLGHTGSINSVTLSPNGIHAVTGSSDATIRVWDTHNGVSLLHPFRGHTDEINSVAFSSDGARITSGSSDCTLCIWDASTGDLLVGPIKGHTRSVRSVAFSPEGSHIASGSRDNTIRLWNSHTGESVAEPFIGHTGTVASTAYSPDGNYIASGSWDYTIRMWSASDGAPLWTSNAHTNNVTCIAFALDEARVVSGSDDYSILVLDAHDGTVLHGPFTGHTHFVNAVAFSPDGTRIVSGSKDKTVRIWDVESGTMVSGLPELHTDDVNSVAFFPDGTRLITGSADGTIRIWDLSAITQASPYTNDWSIDSDGWLADSHSQRLFWVPPDLRREFGFLTAVNPVVINGGCLARIDRSTLLGDRWRECYDASSVAASS